jgi:hypothetical protein
MLSQDSLIIFAVVTATACLFSFVVGKYLESRKAQTYFIDFALRLKTTIQYGGHASAIEMINTVLDELEHPRHDLRY